jgi:hypothetical protein
MNKKLKKHCISDKQISASLKKYIYDAYKDFVKELLIDCGFHPELGETPVKVIFVGL